MREGNRCAGDPGGSENAAKWSEEGHKHRPSLAPSAKGHRALEPWRGGMARPAGSSLFREYPSGPAPEWGWGRRRWGSRPRGPPGFQLCGHLL